MPCLSCAGLWAAPPRVVAAVAVLAAAQLLPLHAGCAQASAATSTAPTGSRPTPTSAGVAAEGAAGGAASTPAGEPASTSVQPEQARATLTADLLAASAFVWRGVTSTNRPVLGPTLALAAPVRGVTVTAGLWGNVEPAAYTGPRDLGTYGGARGPALTMSQVWVEAKRPLAGGLGGGALTLGATEYHYPRVGDLARDYETGELYALLAGGGPLAPSLGVWVDAWKVRGAYAEAAVSHGAALPGALPRWLGAGHVVILGAALGYGAGMGARDGQTAYFTGDGVTHTEVTATSEFALGALTIMPTAHLILGRDAATRIVAPETSRSVKLWLGGSLHWVGPLARPRPRHASTAPAPVRPVLPAEVTGGATAGGTTGPSVRPRTS